MVSATPSTPRYGSPTRAAAQGKPRKYVPAAPSPSSAWSMRWSGTSGSASGVENLSGTAERLSVNGNLVR